MKTLTSIKTYLLLSFLSASFMVSAQANAEFPGLDKSPADILYLRSARGVPPLAKVIYGRPALKSRPVFTNTEGALAPLGEIWRTGANEATEITFYKDVKVAGKDLKAGTYVLHTIPGKNEWTLIFNSKLHVWGNYEYDQSQDVLRVNVPVSSGATSVENFSMNFKPGSAEGTYHLVLGWSTTRVEIPMTF